jgi:hypothetical protein
MLVLLRVVLVRLGVSFWHRRQRQRGGAGLLGESEGRIEEDAAHPGHVHLARRELLFAFAVRPPVDLALDHVDEVLAPLVFPGRCESVEWQERGEGRSSKAPLTGRLARTAPRPSSSRPRFLQSPSRS